MSAIGTKGGRARVEKYRSPGFHVDDVVALMSLEDAQAALDQIRIATLTRQVTHNEANAATKAVDSWVKTESARLTSVVVNELQRELDTKAAEIKELRAELAKAKLRAV